MIRVLFCVLASFLAGGLLRAGAPPFRPAVERGATGWTAERGVLAVDASVSHENSGSLRVEPGNSLDASIHSAPVTLHIGRSYELTGWVRTEDLQVRDLDRSPIAIGAALTMASMPFDVHSAALGGTRQWTRLALRFVASRAEDRILLTVGNGGAFTGKAWFSGVTLDEAAAADDPPAATVRTFGPAYRYPSAGWIYLHIEGQPYERGYQHGHLMAREIPEYLERCAADLDAKADAESWGQLRTTVNALFLRGFDREILEEMKGIAEGASDAGAKWLGRRIDLVDIVVANTTVELGELRGAMRMTPTGLEGLHLDAPAYAGPKHDSARDSVMDHCSAFAATGPATRDGKMVIGHVTWWPLTLAEQTNVMLDIKPDKGHRMIMQSHPGGIESGTDWYQNDAGVVLTETTIRQSPFNIQGTPVAFRAREAIQYGGNVDEVVEHLGTHNNGLYTNEWLIGDAKNNEIAMYELGTGRTKLWRSSKNEWFGGTEGFYWGNNNAKDLDVRLEYVPDPLGEPEFVPYEPHPRDEAWQRLYHKYRGQVDEQFGFLAFRTAPLVSSSTIDAKIATADMAQNLMLWAAIGKPNQREWVAGGRDRQGYEKNDGLFPSGYHLFRGEVSQGLGAAIAANEKTRLAGDNAADHKNVPAKGKTFDKDSLWKGWLLPAHDADMWFVAGSAMYYHDLKSDDLDRALNERRAAYRRLHIAARPEERPWIEAIKGELFLDQLRQRMGDDAFLKLMRDYFAQNTTQKVNAASFLLAAGGADTKFSVDVGNGPAYQTTDVLGRLDSAMLVYGTVREAGANRYAAEQLQKHFLDQYESAVPIRKDFEVTDEDLRQHDVVFVGRPEANSALADWSARLGLDYNENVFRLDGQPHASERDALLFAARNPLEQTHMVLVVAGNDALRTVKLTEDVWDWKTSQYELVEDGKTSAGFLK